MNTDREQHIRSIMSGQARGAGPTALRAALRIAEPFYAMVTRTRNAMYDAGMKRTHRLPRPVISIGNITTGGTGKTPIVQYIARNLLTAGHRPACLLRGYKIGTSQLSDEAALLERSLLIPVAANPDRTAAGRELITQDSEIDLILLDDGFQHRRLYRDLDIVLIDATSPFGYDHVLPRGMLREPLIGLARADVLIITRTSLVDADSLSRTQAKLRKYNPAAPILRASHRFSACIHNRDSSSIESLRGKRIFSFCGIGNPAAFQSDLLAAGAIDAGHRWFGDHHDYSQHDVDELMKLAHELGAEMGVTTEKDWMKIESLASNSHIPISRVQIEMEFNDADAVELMSRIKTSLATPASSTESAATPARGGQSTQ